MSANTLAREPTWRGLNPGLPLWQPADPVDAWIVSAAGLNGHLFAQVPGSGISAGFYRLERQSAAPLFLKKVETERRSLLEDAETIASWLHARGVLVATALPGFPLVLPDGALLIAMPYIDGRRVVATAGDLAALGKSLAALHDTLVLHPAVEAWRTNTRAHLNHLEEIRTALANGRLTAGPEPMQLAQLAAETDLDFIDAHADWQPRHGDLNPGNLLMVNDSAVLLDFEDVPHSMHPPLTEICLAVERFILASVEDDNEAVRLGRVLLDGYGWKQEFGNGMSPIKVLRARALRSLSLLASAEEAGTYISETEWYKFFYLEQMALRRAATLEAVFG
jgi:Ser/Thr protein kinase RdoA (MazF antagonist)